MAQFIINLDSISTESSKNDIMTYLESKPDYATWQDFYDSSAGQTLIELLAGFSAFISSNVIMSRREVYLPYAQTLSANIGIASTLGYSVFRGRNSRLKLTITPTVTETIAKYTIIGSVLDTNLILLEDTILSAGVQTEMTCTIGEIKTEIKTVSSEDMQTFRFENPSVSEDLVIDLDGTVVEYSNQISDLSTDKYVVISNALGAFDLFYLNNVEPKYATGDVLTASYIELNSTEFTTSDVTPDYDGVTAIEITDVYSIPETTDSIKVNAPLQHETQGLIKGREDYPKLLRSLDSDFIDTVGHDFSPAIVEVSYVKTLLDILTDSEKTDIDDALLETRPFGVAPVRIVDPINVNLILNIHIKLLSITTDSIPDYVESIIAEEEKTLNPTLDLDLIENSIEQASYVKTARVTLSANIWSADTLVARSNFVSPTTTSDYIYEMWGDIRKSGSIVPAWTDTVGEIIQDNDIFWECIIDDRCFFDDWSADTNYELGDIISPDTFTNKYTVSKRNNLSDSVEPLFQPTLGETIYDNELNWMCIALQGTPSIWSADTNYEIGDTVIPSTANGFGYVVISYRSKTSNTEPTWPIVSGDFIEDGSVKWKTRNNTTESLLTTNWNEYLVIDQNLSIS